MRALREHANSMRSVAGRTEKDARARTHVCGEWGCSADVVYVSRLMSGE